MTVYPGRGDSSGMPRRKSRPLISLGFMLADELRQTESHFKNLHAPIKRAKSLAPYFFTRWAAAIAFLAQAWSSRGFSRAAAGLGREAGEAEGLEFRLQIGLNTEVELVFADDGEDQAARVEAVAAEHGFGFGAERRERFEHMRKEFGGRAAAGHGLTPA